MSLIVNLLKYVKVIIQEPGHIFSFWRKCSGKSVPRFWIMCWWICFVAIVMVFWKRFWLLRSTVNGRYAFWTCNCMTSRDGGLIAGCWLDGWEHGYIRIY